jgi:HEAT repeat protein
MSALRPNSLRAEDTVAELVRGGSYAEVSRLARTAQDPTMRLEAVRALRKAQRGEDAPTLIEALNSDSSTDVRSEAARALGVLGNSTAIQALLQALRDPADSVVMWSAQALGRLRAVESIDSLADLLQDESWGKRAYSTEALSRIQHRRAVPALLTAAGDKSPTIHKVAVEGLRKLVDSSDVPILKQLATQQRFFRRRRVNRLYQAAVSRPASK